MGKRQAESIPNKDTSASHRGRERMKTKLPGIVKKARDCPKTKFTSLAHVLSPEFLRESWNKLNKRGTYGVDEVMTEQYRENLARIFHTARDEMWRSGVEIVIELALVP